MILRNLFLPLVLFAIASTVSVESRAQTCRDLFMSETERVDHAIVSLARLRISVDLALAQQARTPQISELRHKYTEKELELVRHLELHGISRDDSIKRIRAAIEKLQTTPAPVETDVDIEEKKKAQKEAIVLSHIDGSRIIFQTIKPGSFLFTKKNVPSEITRPFMMAATLTTQIIWMKVLEAAREYERPRTLADHISADPSKFAGRLNPVESVSFLEVKAWLRELNFLASVNDPILQEIMPGHKLGDTYTLPTEAQWRFVASGRGEIKTKFYFGDDRQELEDHAWFTRNSENKTHPVALKKALIIDDQEFYDIYGNVWEWTRDWFDEEVTGGKDPRGPSDGTNATVAGGSWNTITNFIETRSGLEPNQKRSDTGFRLVRVSK
jgi:formylglycine-generating enzyme required for sulfatase activity